MKQKNLFFAFLLFSCFFGAAFHASASITATRPAGYIPSSFYSRSYYDRLTDYAPYLRRWGPETEDYYVQLGHTRPQYWGPSYMNQTYAPWLQGKFNHVNLQKPRGRILLPNQFYFDRSTE